MFLFFFFNEPATTKIYTLSIHDALPISPEEVHQPLNQLLGRAGAGGDADRALALEPLLAHLVLVVDQVRLDRKSTRLNSSHANISYAVFCLKKNQSTFYLPFTLYDCMSY